MDIVSAVKLKGELNDNDTRRSQLISEVLDQMNKASLTNEGTSSHAVTDAEMEKFVPKGAAFFHIEDATTVRDFYFILLPKMTMLAFSAAVEPLRIANQLTGRCLYRWYLISEDGLPVVCSNGVSIGVDDGFCTPNRHDAVFVCSGLEGYATNTPKTLGLLRSHKSRGGLVGGVCTGAYALANAGLLKGRKFTLHWENQPAFQERFPELQISKQIFECDSGITTCGGGAAAIDMMLNIIEDDYGPGLSRSVMDMCVQSVKRQGDVGQRSSISKSIESRNSRLMRLISLMHENIEEPLTLDELAEEENISRRQVERLFNLHLNEKPSQYYKNIRLDRARSYISETDMSVTEIAAACGFSAGTVLSRLYKVRFGEAPSKTSYRTKKT